MMKPFSSEYAKIWEDEKGIIHAVFLEREDFSLPDAKKYLDSCVDLAKGRSKPVLVDVRALTAATPGTGMFLLKDDKNAMINKAVAVLINPINPLTSMLISIVLKFQSPPFPIKIFKEEKLAIQWLEKFL